MKKDTRLYIGRMEVELSDGFEILYNYSIDDTTDPTAVKNGFSKTVTILGTANNNKIFGHYWNVERVVRSGSENEGIYFNASKKAPFQIMINGEVYESGYVKLDKVNNTNGLISYECTLFGDIGSFFTNLSTNSNTGDKLKLSDLDYYDGGSDEFNFVVSADTVYDAWNCLKEGWQGKWQHINFMPAYNGLPDDFDSNKVVMNLSGTALQQTDETGLFKTRDSVVLADLPQEMTEWEMRDLRSYLQRPVVRMKSIISACCDPTQNGGYEVDLDPDFFSSGNPYYEKTWLTLPVLKNLEYSNEEQVLVGSTLIGMTTTGSVDSMMYQDLKFSLGDYGNTTPSKITVGANIFVNNPLRDLNTEIDPWAIILQQIQAPYTSFMWFWRKRGDYYHTGWACFGSLFVQLIAMNGETVVGASQAYNLTSPIRHNGKLYFGNNKHYSADKQFKPYMNKPIYDVLGEFHDDGFHRENSNTPVELYFTIDGLNSPVSQLKIVYWWGASDDKIKHFERAALFSDWEENSWIDIGGPEPGGMWMRDCWNLTAGIKYTDLKAVMGASLGRTGTQVTKAMLLNTEASPCEYLLSYCKMFGLYFRKDVNNNKIQILTRKNFYKRDEVVNLNDYIDRSKEIKMNPVAMTSKWYEFSQEKDETEWQQKYLEARGIEYGIKLLNTGYEFNVEKKELLKDSVIRSGIEGLERSKFFNAYNNDNTLRTWMGMGLHYNLYLGSSAMSVDVPITIDSTSLPINEGEGMKYYDLFPKLQFHDKGGEPTDGNNVLVFFSGFKSVTTGRTNPLSYYITDDNMYQTLLNDGTPCWFFTPSEYVGDTRMAIKIDNLPVFERYLTNEGSTKVDKSLDFGTAQELYVPNYSLTESACVYYSYWKQYIEDVCDPDTKILECYVRVDGKVNDDWLRRFYWFDNARWRLEKVVDWSVGGEGTTKMVFVKTQDIEDYTSMTEGDIVKIRLTASKYRIAKGGETINLYVECDDNVSWKLLAPKGVVLSTTDGVGSTTVSATFPANDGDEYRYYYYTANAETATGNLTVQQEYGGDVEFTVKPDAIIVPSSGGTVLVDFLWKNQGDDYVETMTVFNGRFTASADLTTRRTENKGIITFNAVDDYRLSADFLRFTSHNGVQRNVEVIYVPSSISFETSGGTTCVGLPATGAVVENLPYWVTTGSSHHYEICFTAIANSGASRTGTTTIILPNGSKTSTEFSQGSGEIDFAVDPDNLYFPASGGTKYINITASNSRDWWYTEYSGAWWSLSSTVGRGNGMVAVTVGENTESTRSNYARFSAYGFTDRVYITQVGSDTTGLTVSISPVRTYMAGSGGTIRYTITVDGNLDGMFVTAYGSNSDLQVGEVKMSGNTGTVDVVVLPNRGEYEREHRVNININNPSYTTTAETTAYITQAVDTPYLRVSPSAFTLNAGGGRQSISINTNQSPIDVTTTSPWITLEQVSVALWNISAGLNTGETRTGTVTVTAGDLSETVTVTQGGDGAELSVSPSTIVFDVMGGTATITITSNTNWTIE